MLLTGKQNFRNYHTWGLLSDSAKTVGNLMKDAGYTTAFFGKLQLSLKRNFSQMQNWGWQQYTFFEMPDDSVKEQRYKNPTLINNNGRVADSITKDKYCDDILTQRIAGFINSNTTNPFFIYYSMSLCHAPFSPTPDDPQFASWDPKKNVSDTAYFASMVKYMDKKVGEILDKLRSAGLDTNTLVFFTSDNGTPADIFYNTGGIRLRGGKSFTFERGTHVPLIAYMPAYIARNSINDDLIDFTDFFKTFAALAQYDSLDKYGILDGVSFYNRLFLNNIDSVRPTLAVHYAPYQNSSKDTVKRWVRSKDYKLYDTTGIRIDGKFYNIFKDPNEKTPLLDKQLTADEKAIKARFKNIMVATPVFARSPLINNFNISNITNQGVMLSGSLVDSGATALIERGSNIRTGENAYYFHNNLKDTIVGIGDFSQSRTRLNPQLQYFYSLYGRNKNENHSIGYYWGKFYTLSNPPVKRATALTATANPCSVKLTWKAATFPTSGATNAGYLVFNSADTIVLNPKPNGNPPVFVTTKPATRRVSLETKLPTKPATTITINGLSPDTLYYFTLLPYTYNGTKDSTYNYLTDSAITTTSKPLSCASKLSVVATENVFGLPLAAVEIAPNPSTSNFTLKLHQTYANELIDIQVTDALGRIVSRVQVSGNGDFTFGEDFKPGVYMVYYKVLGKVYQFKIVKE